MFSAHSVLPGANGGSEWSPPAYSPQTGYAYVLGINQLMDFKVSGTSDEPGLMQYRQRVHQHAETEGANRNVFGDRRRERDASRGSITLPKPMVGGALATAGRLGLRRRTRAARSTRSMRAPGPKLWSYAFVGGANAPAMSYAVNGTQYIAVAAGGNFQFNYERGDAIGIFRLKP